MSFSHQDLVTRFRSGKTSGRSNTMFIEGDVLYSYGKHFPLLIRKPWGYLMNGDKYSNTTAKHQSVASRIATVIIPFSILERAGMRDHDFELIHKAQATFTERSYKDRETGEVIKYNERRPDSCIIKDKNLEYWLSSMDNGSYFLSKLPRPVETVTDAYDILKPDMAEGVEGTDYQRQGEWFFIHLGKTVFSELKVTDIFKGREKEPHRRWADGISEGFRWVPKHFLENRNREQRHHHYATEYGRVRGCPYPLVRGQVKHDQGDHRVVNLGKEWHLAIESNHVISYGAGGRVD